MRNILFILLLIPLSLFGADHYVAIGGGGAGTLISPFASITQVNAHTFVAGDNIYFKRGDTFVGTLVIDASGSSGTPITFGAYGTGADPIITGFTTISGWTNEGSGIYSKAIASESNRIEIVTVDGVNTAMGRYPDTGSWLTMESYSTNTSLTDNDLSASPSWTGAEIAVRKNPYVIDRATVTNHSGTTLYYTEKSGGTGLSVEGSNFGYFFQNDLKTLTTLGEWSYNGTTFYMYFGAVDPTTKVVKVGTIEGGITCVYDYVNIEDLTIEGVNATGIDTDGSDYVNIDNCEIRFIGGKGIVLGTYNTVDSSYIHDTNGNGIHTYNNSFQVTNSTLYNISMIFGAGYGWHGQGYGILGHGTGGLVQYNTFENIGYDGTYSNGQDTQIRNNLFDNCVARHYDGGAIYVNGGNTGKIISNNIILNTYGSAEMETGRSLPDLWHTSEGIYMDAYTTNVTAEGNTIYNSRGSGIKLHKTHDVTLNDNRVYNCYQGYQLLNSTANPDHPIRNIDIDGNWVVAYVANQMLVMCWSNYDDIGDQFGTVTNHFYARPVDDAADDDFFTEEPSDGDAWGGYRTFAQWKTLTGIDGSTTYSNVSVSDTSDINLIYNGTRATKYYSLSQKMDDLQGTDYTGVISLPSYSSLILLGEGTLTETSLPSGVTFKKSGNKFLKSGNKFIR